MWITKLMKINFNDSHDGSVTVMQCIMQLHLAVGLVNESYLYTTLQLDVCIVQSGVQLNFIKILFALQLLMCIFAANRHLV